MQILLESYKPFDGKVLGAEYVSHDEIEITYEKDGVKHVLRYNTLTGENSDK